MDENLQLLGKLVTAVREDELHEPVRIYLTASTYEALEKREGPLPETFIKIVRYDA